jgi:xylulose-5-phosphate/fructose-6-phosphate phosphoketolase
MDNPLLKKPLRLEDVKPRLLGHWGTTPTRVSLTTW